MKVVKNGINWNEWILRVECENTGYGGCGAELEINIDDIIYRKGSRYDDEWEHYYDVDYYSFNCPCCGCNNNYIDEGKIPFQVRQIIKNRR